MEKEANKKLKKFFSWLLILSLLNLFIISLAPWISVEDSSKNQLYFNSLMMERSENNQIKSIVDYLFFINVLLWMIIIISSISYISFSIYDISETYQRFTKIMIYAGYASIVVSVLITSLIINLIKNISQMATISLASMYMNIKFAYIPLMVGFLLLIISIVYTHYIVFNILRQRERSKINKKETDENLLLDISKNMIKKDKSPKIIVPNLKMDARDLKINNLLEIEKEQNIDLVEKDKFFYDLNQFEKQKSAESKLNQDDDYKDQEDKIILDAFPPEKFKERTIKSGEIQISSQFEHALSTAIERKQGEKKKHAPSETLKQDQKKIVPQVENEIDTEKKKIIYVKCPNCNTVFQFKKNENSSIKCPNCGVEGIIKFLNEAIKYPPQF